MLQDIQLSQIDSLYRILYGIKHIHHGDKGPFPGYPQYLERPFETPTVGLNGVFLCSSFSQFSTHSISKGDVTALKAWAPPDWETVLSETAGASNLRVRCGVVICELPVDSLSMMH